MPDSTPADDSKLTLPTTADPPSATNPPQQQTWLIFGATGHMGRSLTKAALQHHDLVCAVGQTHKNTLSSMQNLLPNPPSPDQQSHFLPLLCDVRLRDSISRVYNTCLDHFGSIDIIVNCSGYGVIGAFEDQDESEIRNQFETNFMGTLNIIQLSLPYFRQQGEGRYVIFSSASGAQGVPGLAPYCATKYAVEGLVESMLYEVDGFGIKVTLVEPGHMRRDEVGKEAVSAGMTGQSKRAGAATTEQGTRKAASVKFQNPPPPSSSTTRPPTNTINPSDPSSTPLPPYTHFSILRPSAPYATPDSPSKHAQRTVQWYGAGHQPTSVVKAAELVWQLGHCSYPPLRLLLGTYAVESVRERLRWVIEEIEDWKWLHWPAVAGWEEEDQDGLGEEGEEEEEDDDEGDSGKRRGKGKGRKKSALADEEEDGMEGGGGDEPGGEDVDMDED